MMKKQFKSKAEKREYKHKRKKDYYNTTEEFINKEIKKQKKRKHEANN